MYAQGDILLISVENVDGKNVLKPNGELIVGYGESSGHSHVIDGVDVQWLVDACEDINTLNEFALGNRDDNPELYVDVPHGGQVQHKANGRVIEYDHLPIDIPAGTYRVVRQRMATADSFRPVWD